MRTSAIGLVLIITCGFAVPHDATAQSKKAKNILKQLKSVDGEGSGLDADTVRGLTPDQLRGNTGPQGPPGAPGPSDANTLNGLNAQQIIAQANSQFAAALITILTTQYLFVVSDTLPAGFCGCRQAGCKPGDFVVSCNGAVSENGTGYLTQIDQATPILCEACGCAFGSAPTAISVAAVCLNL